MSKLTYLNTIIDTTKPYYIMYNGQRYNAAYFKDNMMFGKKMQVDKDYVCFTALDDNCKLGWYRQQQKVMYSIDYGETWQLFPYVPSVMIYTPTGELLDEYFIDVTRGTKVYIKGTDTTLSTSTDDYYKFMTKGTGRFECTGDLTYMFSDDLGTANSYCFYKLFMNCNITTAPKLPSPYVWPYRWQTLSKYAFYSMFEGCTNLEYSPFIYNYEHLSNRDVYSRMFFGCTSLNTIYYSDDEGPNAVDNENWVYNVANTGTFYKPQTSSINRGDSGVPYGWTIVYY